MEKEYPTKLEKQFGKLHFIGKELKNLFGNEVIITSHYTLKKELEVLNSDCIIITLPEKSKLKKTDEEMINNKTSGTGKIDFDALYA